jgi:serine/threonine protein kinase
MDKNPEHEEAMLNLVKNEVEVMSMIAHPNIVNLLNYSFSDSLIKPSGDSKEVFYLALELAVGGELFDFLAETGAFSEDVARFYFRQLIDVFSYLNENGISHRDIKPENIMFDHEYNLKLADFGFSSSVPLNQSKKGTINYMAPEIIEG